MPAKGDGKGAAKVRVRARSRGMLAVAPRRVRVRRAGLCACDTREQGLTRGWAAEREQKAEKVAVEKIPDDVQKNANPGDTATTKGTYSTWPSVGTHARTHAHARAARPRTRCTRARARSRVQRARGTQGQTHRNPR